MSVSVMRILTIVGVLMSLLWWAGVPTARASEADDYWMCKTSNPVGWCPTSLTNPLPVTIVSGGGAGGTSSNFSAAFPSAGAAAGFTDGVNMQPAKVDAGKSLNIDTQSLAGTAIDTNSGNKSAGTQRIVLATDQPNLTTPLNTRDVPNFGAAQLTSAVISTSASGNSILVTRAVGTIKVYGIFFSCASSVVATLQNGASTGVTGAMTLTTFFLPIQGEPYFTTTSTNNFVLNLGTGVQCSGTIYYLDN